MSTHERIGFGLEFGYPALLMLVIAAVPTLTYAAIGHYSPHVRAMLGASPTADSVCNFLVHTWGIFFAIVAGVIFCIGFMQHMLGVRMKRAHGSH